MRIRTKKQVNNRILKLETSGEIKEIILNEDFLKPKNASVSLCFKGENCSGIIDFNVKEIEELYKETHSKTKNIQEAKVIKFKR